MGFEVRVPGKVLLLGEYVVMRGQPALASSLNTWMRIRVVPRQDGQLHVRSQIWGGSGRVVVPEGKRGFLMTLLAAARSLYGRLGLGLVIESDWPQSLGLGSSSALALGVLIAHRLSAGLDLDLELVSGQARDIQEEVQGFASGYDVLTQAYGGLLEMRLGHPWPGQWRRCGVALPEKMQLYGGGSGAWTKPLGGATIDWLGASGSWERLEDLTIEQWQTLGDSSFTQSLAKLREFWQACPAQVTSLDAVLPKLAGYAETWAYKMCGAGGEDTLLLWGQSAAAEEVLAAQGWYPLNYATSGGVEVVYGGI